MKKSSSFKSIVIAFLLGMIVMFVLDMYFHFNSTKIDRDVNKIRKDINELLK